MKLVESGVIFDAKKHTYTLDGKELSGITGMLHRQLFPTEYKDVPEAVLNKAAERGTAIHETCELIDDLGIAPTTEEGVAYVKNCMDCGLSYLRSEYTVTDGEYFASNIDKVYVESDNEVTLGDIKTTYRLNVEYVTWQLSIYAYLFELQNPGIKVKRIMALWLHDGESKFVTLQRKSVEEVKELLACEREGRQYVMTTAVDVMPQKYVELQEKIIELDRQAKTLEEQRKLMMAELQEVMERNNVKRWETDKLILTIKNGAVRKTFDSKAFANDYPELYEQYIKQTKTKNSIILTTK